jgi:hypothetical protein
MVLEGFEMSDSVAIPFKWEPIHAVDSDSVRVKVFGGWIVKTYENCMTKMHSDMSAAEGYEWRISTCFVPDAKHEWVIGD